MTVCSRYGPAVYAASNERQSGRVSGNVRSVGRVQYEYAAIDAEDFGEIDAYISEKKNAAVGVLNRLGTKFRQQSGDYIYDRNPDIGQEGIDITQISWTLLTHAAAESQSIPAGLAVLNPQAALQIEGVEERTDDYVAAVEDNLSAGKAAWVDGKLLLGNGADNDKAYRRGREDGEKGYVPGQLQPIYDVQGGSVEIRHAHVGSREEREGISGCYQNYFVKIEEVISCHRALVYLEPLWIPNNDEPDGGSWHGGFYTCSAHGGVYDSPKPCAFEEVSTVIRWGHNVICGLDHMLYARLTVRAAQADSNAEQGRLDLEAVLEEAEGYDRLVWPEGDRLIWTDEQGNTLGVGPTLTVFEPGIYRCSVNVANTDINYRTAEAAVTVSGLMMAGN